MTKVLITGATGNVGIEVIKSLQGIEHPLDVYAGVRDLVADKIRLSNYKVNLHHSTLWIRELMTPRSMNAM